MTIEQLVAAGFSRNGEWSRSADTVSCEGPIPKTPGLYLFAIETQVRYVGSAMGTLYSRMKNYARRMQNQNPNPNRPIRLVHVELAKALNSGQRIAVYTRQIGRDEKTDWNGLPVSVILALQP